mmetsp:Transcript_16491/g.22791  ORF Transcript_16491/g.22791 Transcript_16491/m.22791 type:complete len:289 (+) Transcript_16491:179-1045(+)
MPTACDNVLVLSNHKCDLDYTYLWTALARANPKRIGLFKAVIKSAIKQVPVFSWGLKAVGFLYLSRNWESDRAHIKEWAKSMAQDRLPMWLVLYPEGTRYTPQRKARSDVVAVEKGLRPFESELLMPRTKGLVLLTSTLEGHVTSVVDMTIAYSKPDGTILKGAELGTSCLGAVLSGTSPVGTVHMHFQHFELRTLPKQADPLSEWCQELWLQKNTNLIQLEKTGAFSGALQNAPPPSSGSICWRLLAFSFLVILGVSLLATHAWFRWYCLATSCLATLITIIDPPTW